MPVPVSMAFTSTGKIHAHKFVEVTDAVVSLSPLGVLTTSEFIEDDEGFIRIGQVAINATEIIEGQL